MCRDVRILGIEIFMRYFFGIVGHPRISLFYDFLIRRNTLIFQYYILVFRIVERSLSFVDGGIID